MAEKKITPKAPEKARSTATRPRPRGSARRSLAKKKMAKKKIGQVAAS